VVTKLVVVFNPAAGSGDQSRRDRLRELLEPAFDLTILETTPEMDADLLTKDALDRGAELVAAAGGDGTVSAVASVLVGTEVPLGIIPCGTASSLARALGIPFDLAEASTNLRTGKRWTIDTASIDGRTMVLYAAIGLNAEMIGETDRAQKNKWGVLAYIATGLKKASSKLEPFRVELEVDEAKISCSATTVTLANLVPQRTIFALGSSEILADDGLLDATLVSADSFTDLVASGIHLLRTAAKGEPATREGVGYFSFHRLRVSTEVPLEVLIDGEPAATTPIEIVCVPKSLTLIVPQIEQPIAEGGEAKLDGLPDLSIEPR
jgi:YegS/Rv2252/BmrU family lipid kinase